MTRTSNSDSKKRKQQASSLSDDSEPQRKIRKNNKKIRDERDDDNQSVDQNSTTSTTKKAPKWYSYKSSVYRIELQLVLSQVITDTLHTVFFNYQNMRDEMIKHILKNYEESLMIEVNNPNRHPILTHGQFHIHESIQYKRNQCKILEDENCREAYMCVHSEEFSTRNNFKLPEDNNSLFFTEGWLIYRCDAMKTKNINAFNTIHGTMIGDNKHKKTLHWLGIHADHCTIRMIEHEISEMIGTKKEAELEPASNEEIEEEFEKFKAIPMEYFIPTILPQSQYTTPIQSSTPPTPQQPVTYQLEFQSSQANLILAQPVNQSPIQQHVLPFQQQEQSTQHASEEETNKAIESTNGFNWYEDPLDIQSYLLNC